MRALLWVSGVLGVAVVAAFAIAMMRDWTPARATLPPALLTGAALTGASADEAYRAWNASLPPPPAPLTTRYELRAEMLDEEAGQRRSEVDLGIVNANHGLVRLDLEVRYAAAGEPMQPIASGVIVLDGSAFLAWGSFPVRQEFEAMARGKVVRLPQALLGLFFREGLHVFRNLGAPLPTDESSRGEFRASDWIHPAVVAELLTRGAQVTALTLVGDELHVTASGSSAALGLLGRRFEGAAVAAIVAQTPLSLEFDAYSGELRLAEFVLPAGRGSFRLAVASREAKAPAAQFVPPEDHLVMDLTLPAQLLLKAIRESRASASDEQDQ